MVALVYAIAEHVGNAESEPLADANEHPVSVAVADVVCNGNADCLADADGHRDRDGIPVALADTEPDVFAGAHGEPVCLGVLHAVSGADTVGDSKPHAVGLVDGYSV